MVTAGRVGRSFERLGQGEVVRVHRADRQGDVTADVGDSLGPDRSRVTDHPCSSCPDAG